VVLTGVAMDDTMREYLYEGEYEAKEIAAIETYLQPEMDVVDFGACLGFTACFTNKRLTEEQTHFAVEPNPDVQQALRATRERNECKFEILQRAYGTTGSTVEIRPAGSAWSASQYRDDGAAVKVNQVDIETLIEKFDLSNLAIVADIEGAEAEMITGELAVLEDHCVLLIVEFHDGKDDIAAEQRELIREAKALLDASAFELADQDGDVATYIHSERYERE